MASTAPLALERAARRGAGASAHNADLIRVLDVAIALIALAFLAPLLLMIALLVALTSPGPVIFAQRRIGLGGQSFYCLKFRSMAIDAEARLKALLAHDSAARAEWARLFASSAWNACTVSCGWIFISRTSVKVRCWLGGQRSRACAS